jgi:hypothetical protein
VSGKYDSFSRSLQGLVLAILGSNFPLASIVGIAATNFAEFLAFDLSNFTQKVDLAPR